MDWLLTILAILVVIALTIVISIYFKLWLRAYATRTGISLISLVLMSLRKVKAALIVDAKVMLVQGGLTNVSTAELESHFLAGGNVKRTTRALIVANRAKIPLDWNVAAAIDLAGRDILQAVQRSVNPEVIDCPDSGPGQPRTLVGVAQDGIQLKVRVRVTVRTNLSQLIGGATEETVIARVGEGIVSAIGSCKNHRMALSDPVLITRQVIEKGIDSQTAYTVVSVDIADIDVGENIGARLRADQAEADMRVARAKAEERRARAVAVEQEMQALTVENRAAVVLAEAEIPKAQADAFRNGNLGDRKRRRILPKDFSGGIPGLNASRRLHDGRPLS
jgi:uncharacterized protein YqfA (UPF0365 family)